MLIPRRVKHRKQHHPTRRGLRRDDEVLETATVAAAEAPAPTEGEV